MHWATCSKYTVVNLVTLDGENVFFPHERQQWWHANSSSMKNPALFDSINNFQFSC